MSKPRYEQYIPNHYGTLITFRPDVSEEQILEALAKIAPLCDEEPKLRKYDDYHGDPTFYIP